LGSCVLCAKDGQMNIIYTVCVLETAW